jgi:S1-C subfamily serine protease
VQALFADMGATVRSANTGKIDFASLRFSFSEQGAEISQPVLKNTSLYQAGLNRGDKILEINSQSIKSAANLKIVTDKIKIGSDITIKFIQNGVTQTSQCVAKEDPSLEILLQEKPSDAAMKRQKEWLRK